LTVKYILKIPVMAAALAFAASTSVSFAQNGNYSIPEDEVYGYMFAHKSAHGQWPAFATSPDAIHFHDMLCGDSIFSQDDKGPKGVVTNVFLCRRAEGKGYVMVTSEIGGTMVLQTSEDLISWKTVASPKISPASDAKLIWDGSSYVLYFNKLGTDSIWFCRLDRSLSQTGDEAQLFGWDIPVGSVDITWMPEDGRYAMVVDDLSQSGFMVAFSQSVEGPWAKPSQSFDVERGNGTGSYASLKVKEQKGWQFGYVDHTTGGYRLCSSDEGMTRFYGAKNIEGLYGPDKGSFITLNQQEYERLQKWSDAEEPKHLAPNVKNPIFPNLHADPEVLYSEKTGKFYIYPTTDGAFGWHSFDFHCLSSEDFKTWKDEGVILDLRDLTWGDREYAWAPCIIEKPVYKNAKHTKIKGYKYYFYFVHHGTIGVAVADRPEGPFKDVLGKALLTQDEINAPNQIIDPDVFQDPKTGKYYLYWGNSYLWMAELADDMISLVPGTMHELIPRSKIGEYHYLEGSYVFERNGLYYFMWSENITRSSYYRVRYLISDSPTELVRNGKPAKVEETIVIQQDPSLQIFGTGHHSVICMPGTDEWYIVYHRFTRPEGVKMGLPGGYNREVCIDRMEFNPDGTIIPVHPSL